MDCARIGLGQKPSPADCAGRASTCTQSLDFPRLELTTPGSRTMTWTLWAVAIGVAATAGLAGLWYGRRGGDRDGEVSGWVKWGTGICLTASIAFAILWFVTRSDADAGATGASQNAAPVVPVHLGTVRLSQIQETITVYGTVVAQPGETRIVSVPFESRIGRLFVTAGEQVKTGTPLLEIGPSAASRLQQAGAGCGIHGTKGTSTSAGGVRSATRHQLSALSGRRNAIGRFAGVASGGDFRAATGRVTCEFEEMAAADTFEILALCEAKPRISEGIGHQTPNLRAFTRGSLPSPQVRPLEVQSGCWPSCLFSSTLPVTASTPTS